MLHAFLEALRSASRDALVSLGHVLNRAPTFLAAILVVLVFVQLARLSQRILLVLAGRSRRLDVMLQELIERLISVAIIAFGVAVALSVLGLNAGTIVASLGVVGLVVGFALKDLLENFVAGIMILWRRPFLVGDLIRVGVNEGVVREITFRTTTLQTPDGVLVLVPNAQVFTQAVQNYTHTGFRRTSVVFKVPPGTDIERARRALLAAARPIPGVLDEPPPEVLLLGVAADGYDLHLRYWTAPDVATVQRVESAVREAAVAALAALPAPTPAAADGGSSDT